MAFAAAIRDDVPCWGFFSGEEHLPPQKQERVNKVGVFLQGASGCESSETVGCEGQKGNCFLSETKGKKYTDTKDYFKEEAEAIKLFQKIPFYTLQLLPR